MDIIQLRQEKRRIQINEIKASIEKGQTRNAKQIALATSSALGISIRTAQEYVKVAFFELELDAE